MKNISEWLASNGVTGADFVEAERRWSRTAESSWYRAPALRSGTSSLEFQGAEHPGRLLVTGGRVGDTPVYDSTGERIGQVFDISIDKISGRVVHVLLAVGGFLGFCRRYHPLPWALFSYAPNLRGYVLPLTRAEIEAKPSLRRNELEWCGGGYRSPFNEAYSQAYVDLPIA